MFNSEWMDKMSSADMIKLAANIRLRRCWSETILASVTRMVSRLRSMNFYTHSSRAMILLPCEPTLNLAVRIKSLICSWGGNCKIHGSKTADSDYTAFAAGLDGVKKMSKSLGNYIGIDESARDIFGKVMSLSDETMWIYFELISFRTLAEIQQLRDEVNAGTNPRDVNLS